MSVLCNWTEISDQDRLQSFNRCHWLSVTTHFNFNYYHTGKQAIHLKLTNFLIMNDGRNVFPLERQLSFNVEIIIHEFRNDEFNHKNTFDQFSLNEV